MGSRLMTLGPYMLLPKVDGASIGGVDSSLGIAAGLYAAPLGIVATNG
ncbi:hypothetical protein ACNKHM_17830 [Shigella sonnei]